MILSKLFSDISLKLIALVVISFIQNFVNVHYKNILHNFTVVPRIVLSSNQSVSISVAVGMNFSLMVSIIRSNLPLTNVTWTHNGSSVTNRVNITELLSPDQTTATALFQRTSVIPLDTGNYNITATNPVGNATFEFNVIVTGKLMHIIMLFEICLFCDFH